MDAVGTEVGQKMRVSEIYQRIIIFSKQLRLGAFDNEIFFPVHFSTSIAPFEI